MKTLTKNLLILMLFITLPIFAIQELELNPANDLIMWLSPVIIWVVGLLLKSLAKVPSTIMLIVVVPILSFAVTWFTNTLEVSDLSFWMQFIYGLSAVFIDQLKKKITEEKNKKNHFKILSKK
ncbi:MAG TPA: hypothetical protein VF985_09175 [Mariniflexile sp.]